MFLDQQLLEKVKQTELNTEDDIVNLVYDLYSICVEREGGLISRENGRVKIEITEFANRRILSSWAIFINELRPINEPLSNWLREHGFGMFFKPKTSKPAKSKV